MIMICLYIYIAGTPTAPPSIPCVLPCLIQRRANPRVFMAACEGLKQATVLEMVDTPKISWWFSKMGKWWFTPVDEVSENPQVFSMCCDASKAHQTSMKTSARLCRINFIMFCIFLKYTDACFVQASQKLLTKVWREARVKDGKIGPQEQWKQFQDSSGRISNNCTQYSVLCLSGASPIHIQGEQALHSDSQP